jgi:hypothetical protein
MKRASFIGISFFIILLSCKNSKGPDVSGVDIALSTERFEKDFFALDTTRLAASLDVLATKYPAFFPDFLVHILGVPPIKDSGVQVQRVIRQFLHDYRPVYDSASQLLGDISKEEKQVADGLKHVKYYFPQYRLPEKLITFVGPMDAYVEGSTAGYGDAIGNAGLAVGLQMHLGSTFSMYSSEMGLALYPAYISRKFSREYIPVNCIKTIVDDLYPDQSSDKTLIEQMIEKGKRIYLTDLFLPGLPDTLKIGYTDKQLKGCMNNEGLIWNYFVTNGLVYNNDPSLIKNYIGDSPNTQELGEGSPGFIGLFIGWRIVKQYLDKHQSTTPGELMTMEPKKLFEESRYRPR